MTFLSADRHQILSLVQSMGCKILWNLLNWTGHHTERWEPQTLAMAYVVNADRVPVLTPGPARESVTYIKDKTLQIRSNLKSFFWLNQDLLFHLWVNDSVFEKHTPQITNFIWNLGPETLNPSCGSTSGLSIGNVALCNNFTSYDVRQTT